MGSPPVIFWKRLIFLPAATSRKRERLLEARRRDLVIAAGAERLSCNTRHKFAVDSPALSVTSGDIRDILAGR
jgi:hypothetical protein